MTQLQPRDSTQTSSYRRVVVKAGTTLLTQGSKQLDTYFISSLVKQLVHLHEYGMEVVLVSSGAVAAGLQVLGVPRGGGGVSFKQALAAAGQGRLIHEYEQLFERHGIPVAQALLSRRDLIDRLGYLNVRNTLLALLEVRAVPIINENDVVAVDELAGEVFGDNDNLSAMVANLIDADLLVMLGEVDGLFTVDPNIDPDAKLIPVIDKMDEEIESLAGASWGGTGRGGMATKIEAAKLATASGVEVVIANGTEPNVLWRLSQGERIGSLFRATSTKMESRKRWMRSGLSTKGKIVVDKGASKAMLQRHASLLPAGVSDLHGSFERGDIVAVFDGESSHIAAGITNYGSTDLTNIKGVRSDRIGGILGYHYGDEVIHRNNMVVV